MNPRGIDDRLDAYLPEEDTIIKLQKEVNDWKAASKKEGIYGFFLGAFIFFWVGILLASTF